MQTTFDPSHHALLSVTYAESQNDASISTATSERVDGVHKRVQSEKDAEVLAQPSDSKRSKHVTENGIVTYSNKKVSCQITIEKQDELHIFGSGILTQKSRSEKDNLYEGGIKVVKATMKILKHGQGRVSIGEFCKYQAIFEDDQQIKRI